jgi:hypothetical protein
MIRITFQIPVVFPDESFRKGEPKGGVTPLFLWRVG